MTIHHTVRQLSENSSASATNFNQLIQERLKLFGTRLSEVIITKSIEAQNEVVFFVDPRAAIKRDAVIYRQTFKYTLSLSEEMIQYTTIKRHSVMNQTRLEMERCSKNKLSKIMPHSRLFIYWFLGFKGRNVYVNIWVNESEERNTEKNVQDFFTECTGELEHTKSHDGEIRIPCSGEDNQTTPIPSNPERVSQLVRHTWTHLFYIGHRPNMGN
ncbi:hypothetical protein FGIG_01467 [Fasciola gigantica]|uniref:Uncharacterized protein n=1 Tax=Fasciola gigantica TaxID=46835 RepID=A0A504Y9X7_FASGI|nr:hypothetical protein FGIG_01467 [Fasciola gigantica]